MHPYRVSLRTIPGIDYNELLMSKIKRTLQRFCLGVMTCIVLVGLSAVPSLSRTTSLEAAPTSTPKTAINYHLMADLRAAESVLTAQDMPEATSPRMMQRYAAILLTANVVPNSPSSEAIGVAGAVLVGDRLVVRGDFGELSSGLRNYETDPVTPPNPNITSAVHIHRGEPSQNGPFQYALSVDLNDTGMGGRFSGEYTLTAEQLQALSDGQLYVDIHTTRNRAGELRGIFRPL